MRNAFFGQAPVQVPPVEPAPVPPPPASPPVQPDGGGVNPLPPGSAATTVFPALADDATGVIPVVVDGATGVLSPALDADDTGEIPVVTLDPDDTGEIPAITLDPDDTQDIPVLKGAMYGRPKRRGYIWPTMVGRAPEVLVLSTCGVALVAFAYAGGRAGTSWAMGAYWIAQLLVFVPVVVRLLLGRSVSSAEAFMLTIGLAVNQYFQRWLYSPDQFRFPDELQHWSATQTLIRSGRLFQPDLGLPVAVHFPALEELGASISTMTGLSVTTAGFIVAGVAHLTFVGLLFMLVRSTGGSPAMAGTACVLYATALHYLFFDSMYIYQTAALPFLMLAVWACRKWRKTSRENLPYLVVCLIAVACVTVSHHVTAATTVATLALIGFCEAIFGRPRRWAVLALAVGASLIAAGWFVFFASDVFRYLEGPIRGMIAQAGAMLHGGAKSSGGGGGAPANPLWELGVQGIGLLALFVIFCRALLVTWRSRVPLDPWRAALLAGMGVFFATTGVRFFGSQGPELAGRASTFTYVPASIIAAGVLIRWAPRLRPPRRPAVLRWLLTPVMPRRPITLPPVFLGTAVAAVLLVGARTGGWPPFWERLPGPYLVSGFERSIDGQGVDAALWVGKWVTPGRRVAADFGGISLVESYGYADPVNEASQLYYDNTWGLSDELLLQKLTVEYLWVDQRLSQQLPANGGYFFIDPRNGKITSPIPLANLTKFNDIPGVDLVYDNGNIRIYDMRRA